MALSQQEEMRWRPGLGELKKDGIGLRALQIQFPDEVPGMVNPRTEIPECDASWAVGWKRYDWAIVIAASEYGMTKLVTSTRGETTHHENNLGSQ
jgi:hypothetical protein